MTAPSKWRRVARGVHEDQYGNQVVRDTPRGRWSAYGPLGSGKGGRGRHRFASHQATLAEAKRAVRLRVEDVEEARARALDENEAKRILREDCPILYWNLQVADVMTELPK